MNIPNLLTLLRIFFVPLLVAVLVMEDVNVAVGQLRLTNDWLALAIFLAAAATDLLDGYLARRWGQITTIGTLLDPIADKLLISAALISLVQVKAVPAWMAILVIAREFAVAGLRSIAAAEGYTIQASDLGKTKMICQVGGVSLLLISIHRPNLKSFAMAVMWVVVGFAVISALDYFRKFWHKVDIETKKGRRREVLQLGRRRKRSARRQSESDVAPFRERT